MTTGIRQDIAELLDQIPLIDTHEHLFEESFRVSRRSNPDEYPLPPDDFSLLFFNYANADLISSGMSRIKVEQLWGKELDVSAKWKLIAPHYSHIRQTGYGQAIRRSLQILFDVDDLNENTCEIVSEKIHNGVHPGFYHQIMETARVAYAHVNAVDPDGWLPIFRETEQPELLGQDLSTVLLSTGIHVERVERWYGKTIQNLKEWHAAIDHAFETYAPRAIATKNQCAYQRRLDFEYVSDEDAAPLFARFRQDPSALTAAEHKALQDHLFHYCVRKAIEFDLTIKLHCGYFAGTGSMPLEHVRQNAADLCRLLRLYPNARFDIFHINYPYQDEAIALAKHYPNAYVDMCWAWIVNPRASVRFVKEFLTAAPVNKLFTFGGDYRMIELLSGHASIARHGLAQALAELVEEGWLRESDVPFIAQRIMHDNAAEVFDRERTLRNQCVPSCLQNKSTGEA